MSDAISGDLLTVLEVIYHIERFGNERYFDGDIMLAATEAISRGLVPIEFFALIDRLRADDCVRIREARDRHGYMTNYVELTRKGVDVLVRHGRAEP